MELTEETPICRLCNEEDETASNIIFECKAFPTGDFKSLTHKPTR